MGNTCKRSSSVDIDDEPLLRAVRNNDLKGVRKVLNSKSYGTVTKALVEAAAIANTDILQCILHAEDVNLRNPSGKTALLEAVISGKRDSVQALLNSGANPNICDASSGDSPLILAVRRTSIEMIQKLISCGADVNVLNKQKQNALMVACQLGLVEVVRVLISEGADLNASDIFNKTAEIYAAESEHRDTVDYLRIISSRSGHKNTRETQGPTDSDDICRLIGGDTMDNGSYVLSDIIIDGENNIDTSPLQNDIISSSSQNDITSSPSQNDITSSSSQNDITSSPSQYVTPKENGDASKRNIVVGNDTGDISTMAVCDTGDISTLAVSGNINQSMLVACDNVDHVNYTTCGNEDSTTLAVCEYNDIGLLEGTNIIDDNELEKNNHNKINEAAPSPGECCSPDYSSAMAASMCSLDTDASSFCDSGICNLCTGDSMDVSCGTSPAVFDTCSRGNVIDDVNAATSSNDDRTLTSSAACDANRQEDKNDNIDSVRPNSSVMESSSVENITNKIIKKQRCKTNVYPEQVSAKTFPRRSRPQWVEGKETKVEIYPSGLQEVENLEKKRNSSDNQIQQTTSTASTTTQKCHSNKKENGKKRKRKHQCSTIVIFTPQANIQQVKNVRINGQDFTSDQSSSSETDQSSDETNEN